MARPAKDLPSAAEKGRIVSRLAQRGITGITLASIASKNRREIATAVIDRIHAMKGTSPETERRHG